LRYLFEPFDLIPDSTIVSGTDKTAKNQSKKSYKKLDKRFIKLNNAYPKLDNL
jgi:hypothetical protein